MTEIAIIIIDNITENVEIWDVSFSTEIVGCLLLERRSHSGAHFHKPIENVINCFGTNKKNYTQ